VIPELNNAHKVFPRAGSFWSSVASADARNKARRFVESVERNRGLAGIDREAVRLTDNLGIRGQHLDVMVSNVQHVPRVGPSRALFGNTNLDIGQTELTLEFGDGFPAVPTILLISLRAPAGLTQVDVLTANVTSYTATEATVVLSGPVDTEGYIVSWYASDTELENQSSAQQAGRTSIVPGSSTLAVTFSEPMLLTPVVTGSIVSPGDTGIVPVIGHTIFNVSTTGFSVALSSPADTPLYFLWHADTADTRGQSLIPAGEPGLAVSFSSPLGDAPTILGSIQAVGDNPIVEVLSFTVSDVTDSGFNVLLSSPASADVYFNWEAYLRPVPAPTYDTWTFRIAENIVPLAFDTKTGKKVIGNDYTFLDGLVTFRESPFALFDLPRVHIFSYQETLFNTNNYALWLEAPVKGLQEVALYCRDRQTSAQFERAIAVAAGYTVLPFDGVLRAMIGPTYVFDAGVVVAPGHPNALTVGTWYPKGTVIGGSVKASAASGANNANWYRELDWSAGLSLDSLIPFTGLSVPDEQRVIYTTTESTAHAGKYHVIAQLDGDTATQTKFWAHQAAAEDRCNKFISTALGLGYGQSASVNLLDFFFQYLLSSRALIVDLYAHDPSEDAHARAERFVAREAPVGSLPIVRHHS
jgi:hypothetical protein